MCFRLPYDREFLPVQARWRDFLVGNEKIGPAFAATMVPPFISPLLAVENNVEK
jgi:hypothetical protein